MGFCALIAQQGAQQASPWSTLILFVPLMIIFYVFLILPQRRKQKAHEAMLKALVAGDRVVTTGGIVGTVMRADDASVRLKIAPTVEITVVRGYIAGKAGEEIQ